MIVAADFMRSVKARDSEFTTSEREYQRALSQSIVWLAAANPLCKDGNAYKLPYCYNFFCLSSSGDRPLIVQFAAHDAQTLADAACVVAPFSDGVDLNCGCPQRCNYWQ